ncbi:MAG: hypothetical protein Q9210_005020 [Variospora velana]
MSFIMMLIPQKHIFEAQVNGKGNGRDAQARESTLEAIPSAERARVSPLLPIESQVNGRINAKEVMRVLTVASMDLSRLGRMMLRASGRRSQSGLAVEAPLAGGVSEYMRIGTRGGGTLPPAGIDVSPTIADSSRPKWRPGAFEDMPDF